MTFMGKGIRQMSPASVCSTIGRSLPIQSMVYLSPFSASSLLVLRLGVQRGLQ